MLEDLLIWFVSYRCHNFGGGGGLRDCYVRYRFPKLDVFGMEKIIWKQSYFQRHIFN